MLRIITCSIIRSVDKSAHARWLLLATCSPSTKCCCTTGLSLGNWTEINAGGLCIQRVARSGQLRKHLRYSFKMEIPVAQPFGYYELTENPYHIEVLYPQTGRWVFRQCYHVAVVDGLDPCSGFVIRHFIGVLCHGHQLGIDDSAAFRSELVHSVLSDDSASSCSTPAAYGSGTSIDLDSSSPLITASNRRRARTALEIAFPDMIYSTAFGACSIWNSSLMIPEPAIRWPMVPMKLISMWKAPNLSIRRRIGLSSGCHRCMANDFHHSGCSISWSK